MVRFTFVGLTSALAFCLSSPSVVSGECLDLSAGASITQGAWNNMGANGTWIPERLDENNVNTQDPTWTIPDTTWSYPHGEMGKYGPNYMTQYTCSKLQFCNPEGGPSETTDAAGGRQRALNEFSQQDVWKMAGKESFDACNFENAELVGTTSATSCVEIEQDDLTPEGTKDYYASKENCEAGQKVAVQISDWETSGSQCAAIALHIPASSRIRGCDCDFSKKPFPARYGGLCAYAYQEACMGVMQPGDCCETQTCMSKLETWDTPEGKEHEMARREECNDDIPGNCYNTNGIASDMSQDGSTDCCSQTCSSCGSELASGAVFEICTSNVPGNMTATCGRLSRYALEDYVCDFSNCPSDSHWGKDGDAVWKYMGVAKPIELTTPGGGPTDISSGGNEESPPSMGSSSSNSAESSSASTETRVWTTALFACALAAIV